MSTDQKRSLITPGFVDMSVNKQCELSDLQRSNFYFKPKGESGLNLIWMELIDKKFIECPFYGVERMANYLNKDLGHRVDDKRIRRLYHIMRLQTIYPKKNLRKANKTHYKYPYLLRNILIERPNQVWVASNTITVEWCRDIVQDAINEHGCPEILNSDQGYQFTSPIFITLLKKNNIQISVDGKGRALDTIFIERYWRYLKYE